MNIILCVLCQHCCKLKRQHAVNWYWVWISIICVFSTILHNFTEQKNLKEMQKHNCIWASRDLLCSKGENHMKNFLNVLYNKKVIFHRNYHSTWRLAVICPFTPMTQRFWWIKEINTHIPLRITVIHHDVTMCDNVCFYSDWWFWEDFKEEKWLPSDIIGDQHY